MKQALALTGLALLSTLATTMPLIGCTAHKNALQPARASELSGPVFNAAEEHGVATGAKDPSQNSVPTYQTVEQVNAMPPRTATVERKETYGALLKAADGSTFRIGGPTGEQEVWHFVATLKEGQICEFPAAFRAFESRKFYVTADQIRSMPSCKATVQCAAPCYSLFTTADGNWFVIGDPGSAPEVWQFLGTLEKGQTYALPSAFLDHQIKK